MAATSSTTTTHLFFKSSLYHRRNHQLFVATPPKPISITCSAKYNMERASKLSKEISTLKETIERVKEASVQAQKDQANALSERDVEAQAYRTRLEESAQKLDMMKKDLDPEVSRNLEAQLAEAMAKIEALRKELEDAKALDLESLKIVSSELDAAKESLQKALEEENALQSLVDSLKQELENLRKEHAELKEKEKETDSIAGNLRSTSSFKNARQNSRLPL